jgi:periplasmic protein TonB
MERPGRTGAVPDKEARQQTDISVRRALREMKQKRWNMDQRFAVVGLDRRVPVLAWVYSVTFHAAAMGIVLLIGGRLALVPRDEPFQWNVTMVERVQQQEPVAPPRPEPQPVAPARRMVKRVTPPVPVEPPRELPPPTPQIVEAKPDPIVEQAIEPAIEPTPQVTQYQATPVEPLQAVQPEDPAPTLTSTEAVAPAVADFQPAEEPAITGPAVDAKPMEEERPLVAAGAAPIPRMDFGWVREAIWRRIVEMKHYPRQARLNHWQGKVVLRAVIRSDGHLGDLAIKETSGHRVLDDAAMEAVRRICPIPLKQALGRPQIVVMIPVDYRLD